MTQCVKNTLQVCISSFCQCRPSGAHMQLAAEEKREPTTVNCRGNWNHRQL